MTGMLQLTVHQAKELKDMDTLSKQDPYCRVVLGPQVVKTKVVKKGGTAVSWEEAISLSLDSNSSAVKFIRPASLFKAAALFQKGTVSAPHQGQKPGTGVLAVKVVRADLTIDIETIGKQDPYCRVKVGGQEEKRTTYKNNAGKVAVWNEELEFKVKGSPEISVEVWDKQSLRKDRVIARLPVPLKWANILAKQSTDIALPVYSKDAEEAGTVTLNFCFTPDQQPASPLPADATLQDSTSAAAQPPLMPVGGLRGSAAVQLEVWDADQIGSDDFIGSVSVTLAALRMAENKPVWYNITGKDKESAKVHGQIMVTAAFKNFSVAPDHVDSGGSGSSVPPNASPSANEHPRNLPGSPGPPGNQLNPNSSSSSTKSSIAGPHSDHDDFEI